MHSIIKDVTGAKKKKGVFSVPGKMRQGVCFGISSVVDTNIHQKWGVIACEFSYLIESPLSLPALFPFHQTTFGVWLWVVYMLVHRRAHSYP